MKVCKTVSELRDCLQQQRDRGLKIGFVPTMGALHNGHLSLLHASRDMAHFTVSSIFVNPTQFDDAGDLDKYPRPVEQDIQLLKKVHCNAVFLPDVKEVYPDTMEQKTTYDFGGLDKVMEGAHRTGHFEGVAQVVSRLLDIVEPDYLLMGQKDFQQFQIIRRLLEITGSKTELVMCPIVREANGLAMSSRNVRLSKEERARAAEISKTLRWVKEHFQTETIADLKVQAIERLNNVEGMRVDYFELADTKSLKAVSDQKDAEQVVACTAVHLGPVRLIDNMIMN